MALAITGFAGLNSLLAGIDRAVYGRKVEAVELAKPPLFILGHWRSGTTFLHELMIRDPEHNYFTTYQCFTPHHFVLSQKWVVPCIGIFVPERRPMDNMAAGWERPMEDEFALQSLGVPTPYLSTMFPNRGEAYPEYLTLRDLPEGERERWKRELLQFCKRVALRDNRRIVIKSPAHTARVKTLLEMFPNAKFIHIARDPYALYRSTLSLWRSLNSEEGLQTIRRDEWLPEFVLDSLERMYDAYLADRELLGENQLVELRYEELIEDPKAQLRGIYERLDLGDFSRVEGAIDDHLVEVKNYRPNRHTHDDATSENLRRRWWRYFKEFGYE